MKLPGGRSVGKSVAALRKSVDGCLRELNREAGKVLAKGNYSRAEALVDLARAVKGLRAEVVALRRKWREIGGRRRGETRVAPTPLWEYYQPIRQALVSNDGVARVPDIERRVAEIMGDRLRDADLEVGARGRRRWQNSVRRARRHLVSEGFLEPDSGLDWCITAAGRNAAAGGEQSA